jgi:hypothetical protein
MFRSPTLAMLAEYIEYDYLGSIDMLTLAILKSLLEQATNIEINWSSIDCIHSVIDNLLDEAPTTHRSLLLMEAIRAGVRASDTNHMTWIGLNRFLSLPRDVQAALWSANPRDPPNQSLNDLFRDHALISLVEWGNRAMVRLYPKLIAIVQLRDSSATGRHSTSACSIIRIGHCR